MKAPRGWPLITSLGTAAKLSPFPPQHPLDEGAGRDDLEAVGGGVVEGVFDDGLTDLFVAERIWHVGVGEIQRLGARHCVDEGGFLTIDGGEEPAAIGVVVDVELHGVSAQPVTARRMYRITSPPGTFRRVVGVSA